MAATAKRLGYVDGLRALAALEVMVGHMSGVVWRAGLAPALTIIGGYGHAAVCVFIVLSGYSLMLPVARNANRLPQGTLGFYWRRARRILPTYYAAVALSLLLIWLFIGRKTGTQWDSALPVTPLAIVEHVLMVYNFSVTNDTTINIVLWSVALECQIYLLFPLLIVLWRRYHPLLGAVICLALGFVLTGALLFTWIGRLPGYGVISVDPQFLGLFGLGMCAASLSSSCSSQWRRRYVWEALALACLVLTIIYTPSVSPALLDYVTGLGAMAVLLAASRPGWLRAALEWRPLVWIGGFSYSLYLIHAPLLQLIWQYALHPLHLSAIATYLLLLLVGGPLIVLAAWGFFWLFERPFLNTHTAGRRRAAGRLTGDDEATRPLSVAGSANGANG